MKVALDGKPVESKALPSDIVKVRIDRDTGLLTRKTDGSSMFEYFVDGTEPTEYAQPAASEGNIYETGDGEGLF